MASNIGIVESWDAEGRWGKIKLRASDRNWFFAHYKSIKDGDCLLPGADVQFHTAPNGKQMKAVDIYGGFWRKSQVRLAALGLHLELPEKPIQTFCAEDFADTKAVIAVHRLGSYSKTADGTRVSPAQPPVYVPSSQTFEVEKDEWVPPEDGARAGLFEVLRECVPAEELVQPKILTDRNNLLKLLWFLDHAQELKWDRFLFRIDVDRQDAHVILNRVDLVDPETHMPINHFLGYGFSFEYQVTTKVFPGATKHSVIQRVDLGGVALIVRAELDAVGRHGGCLEDLLELKTGNRKYRTEWDGWAQAALQMRLGGTDRLVIGWQEKGCFSDREEVLTFEEVVCQAPNYDRKLGALEKLLEKIRAVAETHKDVVLVYSPPEKGSAAEGLLHLYGSPV